MKTQVCIIGGGPSGLLLSQLLHLKGIATILLEKHSREYVLSRIRAGVLEHGFAKLMREAQCGDRMDREGEIHEGFFIAHDGKLDRIDLQVEVPAVAPAALGGAADGEASAVVAERVARARARQIARQGCRNAELAGDALEAHCRLDAPASKFLQAAAARLGWSARSFHRVLRIARSVADIEGATAIQVAHLAEAIQYRRVLTVS